MYIKALERTPVTIGPLEAPGSALGLRLGSLLGVVPGSSLGACLELSWKGYPEASRGLAGELIPEKAPGSLILPLG